MPTTTTRGAAPLSLALGALLLALAALGAAGDWQHADAQDGRRAVAVTVGVSQTCALLDSGAVECWGRNDYGQADAPTGRFSAVSAGLIHTCGLRETGAVECWGDNLDGQADAPAGRFSAISAGWSHSCGLRETGAVECWGYYPDGRADAPAGRFSAVGAGWYHSCGLRKTGAVECWGGNDEGQTDVPARLRQPTLGAPATGSGGLLDRSAEAQCAGLAALGAALLSLLALALLRRGRRRS